MAYWLYEKIEPDLLSDLVGGQNRDADQDGRGRPRSTSRSRKWSLEVGRFGKAEVLRTGSDRNNFAILL